jgi:LytR cell envelope-related transcriptional attenuator
MSLGVRERPKTVRVSRMHRYEARSRRRQLIGLAVMIALVIAGGTWFATSRSSAPRAPVVGAPSAPTTEVDTLLLAVRGAAQPLLAVVGEGPSPVAMPIPSGLRIEAPGLGQASIGDVVKLPGDPMRTVVSNAMGMWVDHYAVTDLQRLGRLAARGPGLVVTLPQAVTIAGRVLGPGAVTMDTPTLTSYLGASGPNLAERWDVVLTALTAAPPALHPGDLLDTDDLGGTSALLAGVRGANVETFPSRMVGGTVRVPDYGALDALIGELFGTSGLVVRVIVQNASGAPNAGQMVARAIVPLGFRIVLSENAASFNTHVTQIIAIGKQNVDAARRVQGALGAGTVEVSRVPSGIGDITIDVGSDLSS